METQFVNIHTHYAVPNTLAIVNLDLDHPCPKEGLYSYGIHPWALDGPDFQMDEALQRLEKRLLSMNAVAVGEAGLDKTRKPGFERQIELFERQIRLSEDLQKPMILHDVRSHPEIIALRKKSKAKQPWILHGFNGTEQDARQLVGQGIYLSAGESLLHPERKICKTLKHIDFDHLFLETDMAETSIEKVYETAAKLLETDLKTLKKQVSSNFEIVFNHALTPLFHPAL